MEILRARGALTETRRRAEAYAARAKDALEAFPESPLQLEMR